jgi:hypothetical protein
MSYQGESIQVGDVNHFLLLLVDWNLVFEIFLRNATFQRQIFNPGLKAEDISEGNFSTVEDQL